MLSVEQADDVDG
jgi:hypothetical protein